MSDEEQSLEPYATRSRAEIAYLMKRQGMSLSDIADELHVEPSSVSDMIANRFKQEAAHQTPEERESILAMENDRLNFYLSKLWPSIEYGDVKAISLALGIHDRVMKANQLDKAEAGSNQTHVLVVGGKEEDYVNALKGAVDG